MSGFTVNVKSIKGVKKKNFYKKEGIRLFLLMLPFLALVFIICYLPLYGWSYAFFKYRPGVPLTMDKFVGLKYFKMIVQDKYAVQDILRVMGNTFIFNIYGWLYAPLPMIFAMFLSEMRSAKFKKVVQTMTTIPNFISWVLVYSVAYAMFSLDDGLVNRILIEVGILEEGINFLATPKGARFTQSLWGLWKSLGWSSIIYFAAISGIDQALYEAAKVDGAGRFRIMWHITLPELLPTFFVLLVLSIANFLSNGMDQYYVFTNAMNAKKLEVLDLYLYNQGIGGVNYSYSTAVSMLKSVVGVVLLFGANSLSRLVRGSSVI